MPEIERVDGIIYRIYFEEHGLPHYHATKAEFAATINIETLERIAGQMRAKDLGKVQQWGLDNQALLLARWKEWTER